jgi:hypothetical protein
MQKSIKDLEHKICEMIVGGKRWADVPGGHEQRGNRYWLKVFGREDIYPLIGPKHKFTEVYVMVVDNQGNLQEKTFGHKSSSWKTNCQNCYPKVNGFVSLMCGENPNLAW